MKIVIDTREQTPWYFEGVSLVSYKIDAGDYALDGDAASFAVERKSLSDFLGTISSGRKRFDAELARMAHYPARIIIVEGDLYSVLFHEREDGSIEAPDHGHPSLEPQFILKVIAEFAMQGVSVLFAGDAMGGAALCLAILRERNRQLHEGEEGE